MAGAEVSLGSGAWTRWLHTRLANHQRCFQVVVYSDSAPYSDWDNMPHKQVGDYPCLLLISIFWIMQTDTTKPLFQLKKMSRLTQVFQKQVGPLAEHRRSDHQGASFVAVQSFLGKLDGKKSLVNNEKWRGSRRQGNGSQFGELWRKQTVSYNHPL